MSYYQEGCDIDSSVYVLLLKPNLSSANKRETLITTLAMGGLGH